MTSQNEFYIALLADESGLEPAQVKRVIEAMRKTDLPSIAFLRAGYSLGEWSKRASENGETLRMGDMFRAQLDGALAGILGLPHELH